MESFGSLKYSFTRLNVSLLHMSWDRNVYWLLLHRVLVDFYLWERAAAECIIHTQSESRPLNFNLQKMFPRLRLQLKAGTCFRGDWESATAQGASVCWSVLMRSALFTGKCMISLRPGGDFMRLSESLSRFAASCVSHRGRPGGLWGVHDNTGAQTSVFWQQGRLPGQHHRQHLLAGEGRRCNLFHIVNNLHHPHCLSSSYFSIPKHTPIVPLCSIAEQKCSLVVLRGEWEQLGMMWFFSSRCFWVEVCSVKQCLGTLEVILYILSLESLSPEWAQRWLRLQLTLLNLLLFFKNVWGHKICCFLSAYFPFGS